MLVATNKVVPEEFKLALEIIARGRIEDLRWRVSLD